MSSDYQDVKEEVLETAKLMLERGLVAGTSGNVSARASEEHVVITPSSIPYETMTLADLTVIDLDAEKVEGDKHPSSEKHLHTHVYKAYGDVNSVIHTHPIYATMFAVTRQPIPPVIDEFTMYVGGEVPVCDYAPSGTEELANNATSKLETVGAALLANHGMVACGPSLKRVMHISGLVERSAQIIWGAQRMGSLEPLPDEVNENFVNVYKFLRQTP